MEGYPWKDTHGWRRMKKAYWRPLNTRGRWDDRFYAQYRSGDEVFNRTFTSGLEREEFIRDQNQLVRRYGSDEAYIGFYKTVLTIIA